jgi:peptide/nickel transport system permease protein
MRSYVIRRLLLAIPTMMIVSIIIFVLIRLIPGSILDAMAAAAWGIEQMDRAAIAKALGLDVSIPVQFARWIGAVLLHGDLGKSLWKDIPVTELIAARWPVTAELGILGLIIAQVIALPIGVYSALRQDTWGDYIARSFAIFCIAVPGFWLGTMVIVFPSIWWGWSPPISLIRFADDPVGNLKMFLLPALVLGMSTSGLTMRLTRTMMLEVLRQDYVRTAWAKGLREGVVVRRHAVKNALIPVITLIGIQLPVLVGGSVIIEQIFSLPGMGRLVLDAVLIRDYTIVSGVMLVLGWFTVFSNLLVDVAYGLLDPRIHYK